jgi:hypothetical protein
MRRRNHECAEHGIRATGGDGCGPGGRCRGIAILGLFVTVGFLASGGPPNLVGRDGTSVAIGTWIQMVGVLTALVANAA